MEEGEPIEHRLITRAIENAQKKVEAHNFEIRKHLLEYDDVMNKQREVIYTQRKEILAGNEIRDSFLGMVDDTVTTWWRLRHRQGAAARVGLARDSSDDACTSVFGFHLDLQPTSLDRLTAGQLRRTLAERARQRLRAQKLAEFGDELMDHLIKVIMLQVIDTQWKDHLLSIDHLKEGIGLRGYGQKDPKQEYKKEAFELFKRHDGPDREEAVPRSSSPCSSPARKTSSASRSGAPTPPHALSHGAVTGGRLDARPRRQRGRRQGRSERSVSLRQRQEIQALPRPLSIGRRSRHVPR